jgi:hypothetical protein
MLRSKEAAEGGGDDDDYSTTATVIQKFILEDHNLRTEFPFRVRQV